MITGAKGILGRRVMSALNSENVAANAIAFEGDICSEKNIRSNLEKLSRLDQIINCAAVVPVGDVESDPERAAQVNAMGPFILADVAARHSPGVHFLQVSSSHVYEPSQEKLDEESPLKPSSLYGSTKLGGEILLKGLAASRPFRLCIARVFSLYAEEQTGSYLYPSLQTKLAETDDGETFPLRGWNNVRDFSHADEIASHLLRLVSAGSEGVFNVGSGHGMTIGEFAEAIAGRPLFFDNSLADASPTTIVANTSKLEKVI